MTETVPRVVIADDDPVYCQLMEKQIGRWGYQTVVVKNGFEAKQLALAEPNTTLAILDWQMPSMDGLEACRQIRKHRSESDIYILIVSSNDLAHNLDEVKNAGADDLVTKGSSLIELKSRLDSAYQRQLARRVDTHTDDDSTLSGKTNAIHGAHPNSVGMPKYRRAWLGHLQLPNTTIVPDFDSNSLQFRNQIAQEQLLAATQSGDLTAELLDSVLVCPQCECLPTFRRGCSCCGSGRIEQERLIHHFACAHVARVSDFDTGFGLACPKCRTRDLTAGTDIEYQYGPMRCIDCRWTIEELATIGHCLACGFRFPAEQAFVKELVAYHARRLETVGHIAAS